MRNRIIHIVVVDVLVVVELCAAMYFANANEQYFNIVFLGVFFGLLAPTLYLSRVVGRRVGEEAAGTMPGLAGCGPPSHDGLRKCPPECSSEFRRE